MSHLGNHLRTLIFISLVVGAGVSCKDENAGIGPDGSPSDVFFPATNVSYSRHVQVVFNQACSAAGCHGQGESTDALRLDSYENLMYGTAGTRNVVVPGSPENSPLVWRIEGRVGTRMPPAGNPLNQNQVNGIRTWIAEGAQRN